MRRALFLGFMLAPLFVSAQTGQGQTTVPADDPECLKLMGISDAVRTGDNALFNKEVCDAYRFLLERNGTGTRGNQCYKSQTDRILKLNPGFAVGLHKALTEMEKLYGGKNIIQSGYRCDGSNGNHPRGCAVDIIWTSCQTNPKPSLWPSRLGNVGSWECSSDRWDAPEQQWIKANGKNAPYNIHFPYSNYPEGHHVEPINTAGCVTSATSISGSGDQMPGGTIASSLRSLFSPQQPAMQPAIQATPMTQAPVAQPVSQPGTNPTSPITLQDTPTATITSKADVLMDALINPDSKASSSPLTIIVSGADTGGLKPTNTDPGTNRTVGIGLPPAHASQTFVSADLAMTSESPAADTSRLAIIVNMLKEALVKLATLFTPFGGGTRTHLAQDEYGE